MSPTDASTPDRDPDIVATVAALAPTMLLVEDDCFGADHPFSGEKLSPVLAVYSVPDFDAAVVTVRQIYAWQGAGHSVGLHTRQPGQALQLGTQLPVSRVIVDQAHCIAPPAAVSTTACRFHCPWVAAPGAATISPTT